MKWNEMKCNGVKWVVFFSLTWEGSTSAPRVRPLVAFPTLVNYDNLPQKAFKRVECIHGIENKRKEIIIEPKPVLQQLAKYKAIAAVALDAGGDFNKLQSATTATIRFASQPATLKLVHCCLLLVQTPVPCSS